MYSNLPWESQPVAQDLSYSGHLLGAWISQFLSRSTNCKICLIVLECSQTSNSVIGRCVSERKLLLAMNNMPEKLFHY